MAHKRAIEVRIWSSVCACAFREQPDLSKPSRKVESCVFVFLRGPSRQPSAWTHERIKSPTHEMKGCKNPMADIHPGNRRQGPMRASNPLTCGETRDARRNQPCCFISRAFHMVTSFKQLSGARTPGEEASSKSTTGLLTKHGKTIRHAKSPSERSWQNFDADEPCRVRGASLRASRFSVCDHLSKKCRARVQPTC